MAFDWGALFKSAVTIGSGIYDYMQQDDVSDKMYAASTAPQVDPFGSQRPYYQQQLRNLYQDPSSLQNLPGYKFAQEQGEKAINRQAAKTGHYVSTNRLYDISKFNTGLAEQMYGSEADRLAKLAGSQFGPSAQAYANLQATGGQGQIDKGSTIGRVGGILTQEDPKSGTSILGDILKGFGINFDQASGSDGGTGGALDGLNYQEAIARIANGEDPQEVLKDTALDYGKEKGLDWLKSEGADLFSEQTGIDLGQFGLGSTYDAANALGGGAAERATDLYGLGPNADLGGADVASMWGEPTTTAAAGEVGSTIGGTGTPGTLSESWQGMQDAFSGGTAASAGAGVAGGLVGSYLGSKIPGLGTDTPLGGYMGGVAGTALGAGAVGGGAAAMAAAGPAAIVGAALMVGQGIYGMVKGAKQRDQNRDDYRRVTGQASYGATQVADPTGLGEGMGSMYESQGQTFFLPSKYYENLKRKNLQGEYGHFTEFAAPQGSYGYWLNPNDQKWYFGSFGNSTFGEHAMDMSTFRFQDKDAAYAKRQEQVDKHIAGREADKYKSRIESMAGNDREGMSPEQWNKYAEIKGDQPYYQQQQVRYGGGDSGLEWIATENSPQAEQQRRMENAP